MPNLRDRLPTRTAQETSTQPSPEQTLLSRTQELQSMIAELKEELSETQKLNQTLREEKQHLERENGDLSRKYATQERRLMEAEQTIRNLEDETGRLRELVDMSKVEALRRARMELLLVRKAAERKAARQTQDHEAEMQQLSDDFRRQIEAAGEEAEIAKGRVKTIEGVLLLLIVIMFIILCAC